MNGQWQEAKTPHERLAVVTKHYFRVIEDAHNETGAGPTPATGVSATDLAEFLEPFTERERILARIEEARVLLGEEAKRISELVGQLFKLESERIPAEFRLYP